jgi:hypothetical protein
MQSFHATLLLVLFFAYALPVVRAFVNPIASLKDPFAEHKTVKYPFEAQHTVARRTAIVTAAAAVALTPDLRHAVGSTIHSTKPLPKEVQSRLNEAHSLWNAFWQRRRLRQLKIHQTTTRME